MIISIIFLLIFIVSFIIITILIIKRFPQIKSINTDLITKEIEDKQKKELIESRLDRKMNGLFRKNNKKNGSFLNTKIEDIENKIKQNEILEQINKFSRNKKNNKENIQKLLEEANNNIKNNDLTNAENICFALLKKEKDNIDILDKLAYIYSEKNDTQKVIETYEYIITILKRNKKKNIDQEKMQKIIKYKTKIAEYYFNDGNYKKSLEILNDLIIYDENNPKLLDLLIECNINLKNKFITEKMLNKLEEINPENEKIEEFHEKIDNIFK